MPLPLVTDLIQTGDWIKVTHPPPSQGGDGKVMYVRIKGLNVGSNNNPNTAQHSAFSDTITLDVFNTLGMKHVLDWHNCYSFGNGVESNRIADIFNQPQIKPGVKVSTVFEDYKEEHRKYGLIYSGLYNSTSGVNNLNQFVAAEKITKDINPTYGSIQKLHARDTDLVTLCEDKVLRILSNKDAVYNADGSPQLVATGNVLGQTIPFIGEYGISKNPESFVSEAYRSYFTDKQRGAVMRLSRDGLTPISNHGMRDWFRDNLSTSTINLLGEDNLSWGETNWDIPNSGLQSNLHIEDGVAILGYYNDDIESNKFGLSAKLRKNGVLEVGKKYRFQFDTTIHSGLKRETLLSSGTSIPMMQEYPTIVLQHGWGSPQFGSSNVAQNWRSYLDDFHVVMEFVAESEDFEINTNHVNSNSPAGYYTPHGGSQQTITSWVEEQRAGYPSLHNPYVYSGDYLYGSTVGIKNLVLEEIKVEPKVLGSYDDRQEEYNVTIHSTPSPKTLSFREDVKGWVSFKSFHPDFALSCANYYYTIKDGLLWQHHVTGAKSNTFYGLHTSSKLNVILNDSPSSMKSFHALDYEGSQSKVIGIKTLNVTGVDHNYSSFPGRYFFFNEDEMNDMFGHRRWTDQKISMKQYRDGILLYDGLMRIWDSDVGNSQYPASPSGGPNKGHGRRTHADGSVSGDMGDFNVGDIITTRHQEEMVDHFNSMAKPGWYVNSIKTDKQEGNLHEFVEKEGKWFNYVKGMDSDISETTNFGSFDIQGIGFLKQTITTHAQAEALENSIGGSIDDYLKRGWNYIQNEMVFENPINTSLQVGDAIYYETPSQGLGVELVENGRFDDPDGVGWSGQGIRDFTTNSGAVTIGDTTATYSSIEQYNTLTIGKEYEVRVSIIDHSLAASTSTIAINNRRSTGPLAGQELYSANYHYLGWEGGFAGEGNWSIRFKANRGTFELYVSGHPNYGNIITIDNVSVREVGTASVFGFTRLDAGTLVKFGWVSYIDHGHNMVRVSELNRDEQGNYYNPPEPDHGAFIMFAKNQAINTSSLLGYYADVELKNNSLAKAEIFSLSSEVTESSR